MFKKILLLISVAFFLGCSNDSEENQANESGKVPLKIKESIYYDQSTPPDVSEMNFIYQNTVLTGLKSPDNSREIKLIYNGQKVTKIEYYRDSNLNYENTITYEGDNIKSVVNGLGEERTDFLYENGVLQKLIYSYRSSTSEPWVVYNTKECFFNNSNLIKEIENDVDSPSIIYKKEHQFDTKNNPFKNLNPYVKFLFEFETIDAMSLNNIILTNHYNGANSTTITSTKTYENTYNEDGYPILVKKKDGTTLISQIEIEY